jgi:hypothetical protein
MTTMYDCFRAALIAKFYQLVFDPHPEPASYSRASIGISRHRLEPLEAQREPIPVWPVLGACRQVYGLAIQSSGLASA